MRSKRRSTIAQKVEASTVVSRAIENESKTWHNYPARIAYVQLPNPASPLGTRSQRHDTTSPSDVNSYATEDAQNKPSEEPPIQNTIPSQASLLGLPAELRNRIYENIWPGDLIHVSTRTCKADAKGAWETNINKSSWDHKPHFVRWTHTICQVPDAWEQTYIWSKRSDLTPKPVNRHDACEVVQNSFRSNRYLTACRKDKQHSCPKKCQLPRAYSSAMTKQYGPPSKGGLESLHVSSKLHLDILSTCRQIYSEARLLPYARSVWHFDHPATLAKFATISGQIRALGISDWSWADILSALKALPQVSKLQYSCNYSSGSCGRMALASEMLDTLRYMPKEERVAFGLKEVDVILGEDMGEQGRDVRREIAAEMERSMIGD